MKRIIRGLLLVVLIMLIGGLSGLIMDRYLFPYFSASRIFSHYDFLKKANENVTVINRTEQVTLKEETSINKISNQAAASIVNILLYPTGEKSVLRKIGKTEPKNQTGIIVTSDGLIMTYLWPANSASSWKYKVLTADGNSYDGILVGQDNYSNLVFLKISAGNLTAASFGNSDDDKPGEKIIAIGNSFGSYANRYAAGVLGNFNANMSINGKMLPNSEKLQGVFGTDFNYEEQFVGGALVDYTGQMVGIIGEMENSSGISYFQIPSNKVKSVINRAIKKDFSSEASLGINYLPLTKSYALLNANAREKGALVIGFSSNGNVAVKNGIRSDDIITSVNGVEINESKSLPDLLYQFNKGDNISLSILRNGQSQDLNISL